MYFYLARQTIFERGKEGFAAQLLFTDSDINVFSDLDGDQATRKR